MQFKTRAIALAMAAGTVAGQAWAGSSFKNNYFFGDSLTDSGYFAPALGLPPGYGKATTNPGPVWAEVLAGAQGLQASPNNQGGTNYAQGGARAGVVSGAAQPVTTQITNYLAVSGGRADPRSLYSVWIGGNDVRAAASDPANAQSIVVSAAQTAAQQVARLQAAGARYIVVVSLPDIGLSPEARAGGPAVAAGATQLSNAFNQILFGGIGAAGVPVIAADTFTLLREFMGNPAAYGFTNTTGMACTVPSTFCTPATLVSPNAAQTYVFADGIHPTTAAHAIIGNYIQSIIMAPSQISLLAESPVATRQTLIRNIADQVLYSNRDRAVGSNSVWIQGGGGRLNYNPSGNAHDVDGTPWTGIIGIDRKLGEGAIGGVALSYGRYNGDFSSNRGGYTQTEVALSGYVQFTSGPWRVDGIVTYGALDYDVDRAVQLGNLKRKMPGSTDGNNFSIALFGAYDIVAGSVTHGPWLGIQQQWISVDSFTESGGSTALSFNSQKRESTVANIGYRIAMDAGNFTPFGSIAWNYEFNDGNRDVSATLTTLSAPYFTLPGVTPRQDWGTLSGGFAYRISPSITATLTATTDLGSSDVTNYGGYAGINFRF